MKDLEIVREKIQSRYRYVKTDEDLAWNRAIDLCANIINAHLSRGNTPEFARSSRDNDGWIPVEDRLPKTNGTYNVTRHIDGHFISDSAYFDGQNTWHSDNRVNHSRPYLTDVIAWRPLPEPYCPERSRP